MALGPWRAPASLFCWLVAALSATPVAALAWRAGWEGFAELPRWIGNGVSNSLLPAALAATIIALVAIPVGHGLARRDRITAGMDIVAFAAFVAPPALLGVGLVALWNRPETGWLYGSWLIIALGYVGRYATIGVRAFAGLGAPEDREGSGTAGSVTGSFCSTRASRDHAKNLAFRAAICPAP